MYKLPEEIAREIFEQQLRDRILSEYNDDIRRHIREYIFEVSEKLNSRKDLEDKTIQSE